MIKGYRAVVAVISIALSIAIFLNGCSSSKTIIVSETETGGEISRAQFVQMVYDNDMMEGCLNKTPYYSDVNDSNDYFEAVQACYEWGYIEQTNNEKKFHPDNSATNFFAMQIAVKAVGMDIINASGFSLKTDQDLLYFFKEKTGMNLPAKELLTKDVAEKTIAAISDIESSIQLKTENEMTYTNNAYVINSDSISFNNDGKSAEYANADQVSAGDCMVLESSEDYYSGNAFKILSVSGNTITYEEAKLEDVITEIFISGEAVPEIVNYSSDSNEATIQEVDIEDVAFDGNKKVEVVPLGTANSVSSKACDVDKSLNIGDKAFEITVTPQKNCTVTVKLALTDMIGKIYLDANLANLEIRRLMFSFSAVAKFQASIKGSFSSLELPTPESPLGMRIEATFFKIIGIGINLKFIVKLGGSISLTYALDQSSSIEFKQGCLPKYKSGIKLQEPKLDVKAKASITADLSISPDLLNHPITDLGIEAGFEGTGSVNKYKCLDLDLYFIATGYVGSKDSICAGLGLQFKRNLITKENSFYKKNWHIENGEIVDKCTMSEEKQQTNNAFVEKIHGTWCRISDFTIGDGSSSYDFTFDENGIITIKELQGDSVINSEKVKYKIDKQTVSFKVWNISYTVEFFSDSNLAVLSSTNSDNETNRRIVIKKDIVKLDSNRIIDKLSGTKWSSDYFKSKSKKNGNQFNYISFGSKERALYDGSTENSLTFDLVENGEKRNSGDNLVYYYYSDKICNCEGFYNDDLYEVYIEITDDNKINAFIQDYSGDWNDIVFEQWTIIDS